MLPKMFACPEMRHPALLPVPFKLLTNQIGRGQGPDDYNQKCLIEVTLSIDISEPLLNDLLISSKILGSKISGQKQSGFIGVYDNT